jgi:hypothetical protein
VLKKSVLDFFKASWQKHGFAKMLKLLKRKDCFNNLARRPGARSLFFNRLLKEGATWKIFPALPEVKLVSP